ncbi:Signal transduction histidine kinase [Arthrobacter sp. P2b]|nr:Signal transduction histidine kinase [Arthrobacter sp. P2b]
MSRMQDIKGGTVFEWRQRLGQTAGGSWAGAAEPLLGTGGGRWQAAAGQLPLAIMLVLLVAAAGVFSPATLQDPAFQAAVAGHALLFALAAIVPWHRLPSAVFSVVPVLDCVAIGFTRQAGGPEFSVLSLLLVFPVIRLSVNRGRPGVLLAILGVLLSATVPAFAMGRDDAQDSAIRIIFLPLIMAGVALTAHFVARALINQHQTLTQKDRELADTLAESIRRQQLLDAVLSSINVGVWVIDQDGRGVLTNKALEVDPALAGLATGRRPLFLPDRTSEAPTERLPNIRAAKGEEFNDELYYAGSGNDQRAYSVSASPIRSAEGVCTGAVVTFADVTQLINALKAKDNFVATVSHELRTPLTSILGYLEIVLDEPDHKEIEPELLIIHRNAKHLLALVNDLIAVASDRVELSVQEADITHLLAQVVESLRPRAASSGLRLVMEAGQPLIARVDPGRIRHVFKHLLSNAIKYSPEGGTVTASLRSNGQGLVCSITDPGIGMTEDEAAHAFSKFFRSDRSRDTAIPGAGLGLPISKTIVEGHGGSISINTAPGKGTTVTLSLPYSPA